MPGTVLTTTSSIQCPHGGRAILSTSDTTTSARAPMLLETDIHTVAGCSFYQGTNYSPCVTIAWSAGAGAVTVGGTKVLVKSSIGQCKNAGGVVQGVAIIASTQTAVTAR